MAAHVGARGLRGGARERTLAMGILEKIKDIELEMSRTQKNKATEGHLGILKSKLAKLRTELLNPPKAAGSSSNTVSVALIDLVAMRTLPIMGLFSTRKGQQISCKKLTIAVGN